MAEVQIIVGSVMGTAQEVAQTLQQTLSVRGHLVRLNTQFRKGHLDTNANEILLICTSNTGMGDLPANIMPFYEYLKNDFPKLAGRRYGLVSLGDSSYPNFAQAGKTLDEAMADLGAQRIGAPLLLDAIYVDNYSNPARDWAAEWSQLI